MPGAPMTANSCPDPACASQTASQRMLTDAESEAIGLPDWIPQALRCAHCGCVYTSDDTGEMIRGHFEGMFIGWRAGQ